MSQENVEIVRRAYELLDSGDLAAALERLAPDLELDLSSLYPDAPVLQGSTSSCVGSIAARGAALPGCTRSASSTSTTSGFSSSFGSPQPARAAGFRSSSGTRTR